MFPGACIRDTISNVPRACCSLETHSFSSMSSTSSQHSLPTSGASVDPFTSKLATQTEQELVNLVSKPADIASDENVSEDDVDSANVRRLFRYLHSIPCAGFHANGVAWKQPRFSCR